MSVVDGGVIPLSGVAGLSVTGTSFTVLPQDASAMPSMQSDSAAAACFVNLFFFIALIIPFGGIPALQNTL